MAEEIISEFDCLWNSQHTLALMILLMNYKEEYNIVKHQRDIATQEKIVSLEKYNLKPNSMQIAFITNGEEETTLNRIVGETSKEDTIERFKTNGYIKLETKYVSTFLCKEKEAYLLLYSSKSSVSFIK